MCLLFGRCFQQFRGKSTVESFASLYIGCSSYWKILYRWKFWGESSPLLQWLKGNLFLHQVHSASLTWNLKMMISKRNLLFQWLILRWDFRAKKGNVSNTYTFPGLRVRPWKWMLGRWWFPFLFGMIQNSRAMFNTERSVPTSWGLPGT